MQSLIYSLLTLLSVQEIKFKSSKAMAKKILQGENS